MLQFVERRSPRIALWALILIALAACISSPPVQEMSDARQAVRAAEAADAGAVAPQLLDQARELLAEAESLIEQSAFGPARANAVRARNRASRALAMAQSAQASGD